MKKCGNRLYLYSLQILNVRTTHAAVLPTQNLIAVLFSSCQTQKHSVQSSFFFFLVALIFIQLEICSVNSVSAVSRTGIGWKETLLVVGKHSTWQVAQRSLTEVGCPAPLHSGYQRACLTEVRNSGVGVLWAWDSPAMARIMPLLSPKFL